MPELKKPKAPAKHVPYRCGIPKGPMYNRPSVEYTGHGNDLVYDAYGGRIFRASEKWVRERCDKFIKRYTEGDGDWVNYNDLYKLWEIEETDFGATYGYSPSENWKVDLEFTFTWLGPGTELYDKFGEKVLVVEPMLGCFPMESYWEV